MVCFLVAGAAAAIVVVIISLSARPWRFENYVVTGNCYLTAPEVVAATGLAYGANLFTADFKEVEDSLCRNPRIRTARVSRRIPGQLVVDIEERPACAAVVVDDELYKIAPDGVILEKLAGHYEDLPVLTGVAFSVRGKVSGRVLRDRDIASGLAAVGAIAAVDKSWAAEIDAVDVRKRTVVLADGMRRVRYDADFDEDVARVAIGLWGGGRIGFRNIVRRAFQKRRRRQRFGPQAGGERWR